MVFMISKTPFFCTECMATVELINESFECDCQQTIYTPDEDGKPAIYDMPKGWINLSDAIACLRLFGSLEFAQTTVAMLLIAAIDAYKSEVIDTEMESSLVGPGCEYADKADWVNSRLNEWRDKAIEAGKELR